MRNCCFVVEILLRSIRYSIAVMNRDRGGRKEGRKVERRIASDIEEQK